MADSIDAEDKVKHKLTIDVDPETVERITYLAQEHGISVVEMAGRLLATEAEAEAGLRRGPWLRKYAYR